MHWPCDCLWWKYGNWTFRTDVFGQHGPDRHIRDNINDDKGSRVYKWFHAHNSLTRSDPTESKPHLIWSHSCREDRWHCHSVVRRHPFPPQQLKKNSNAVPQRPCHDVYFQTSTIYCSANNTATAKINLCIFLDVKIICMSMILAFQVSQGTKKRNPRRINHWRSPWRPHYQRKLLKEEHLLSHGSEYQHFLCQCGEGRRVVRRHSVTFAIQITSHIRTIFDIRIIFYSRVISNIQSIFELYSMFWSYSVPGSYWTFISTQVKNLIVNENLTLRVRKIIIK